MATADGYVETKAYFRKYSIAVKLSLSLAAQQATPVAIYPEGYCCSRATPTVVQPDQRHSNRLTVVSVF
jgi:hypothetical protein